MARAVISLFDRLRRHNAGNIMPLIALALPALIILIGSAFDLSVGYMARAKLQNACDAAVLAGRQSMTGTTWTPAAVTEARKFFIFNFPTGTHGATNVTFTINQNSANISELIGKATARIPNTLTRFLKIQDIPIQVDCNASLNPGHNDIALVLDVTGSMSAAPLIGGASKISRLRAGALSLYNALANQSNSVTRYAIIPYSMTVNVARSLADKDILINQNYITDAWTYGCNIYNACFWSFWHDQPVSINNSSWAVAPSDTNASLQKFRTSGNGCIEERPSTGQWATPVSYTQTITESDVDLQADSSGNDIALQFGRYDPAVQKGETSSSCPAESTKLRTYSSLSDYTTAINSATSRVAGGTYHDIGMLWGLRFISRTGFFAAENPTTSLGMPIQQHIIFMTDGNLQTDSLWYSAYGLQFFQMRARGAGILDNLHTSRFLSACQLAKARGITVWVIALDVTNTAEVSQCATTPSHFFVSNGSDLDKAFTAIGKSIGNLRLTR